MLSEAVETPVIRVLRGDVAGGRSVRAKFSAGVVLGGRRRASGWELGLDAADTGVLADLQGGDFFHETGEGFDGTGEAHVAGFQLLMAFAKLAGEHVNFEGEFVEVFGELV